jgi:hypothetical protein
MRKITLIGGVAVMAMSLTFLSSCKKEEITSKKTVSQSGNQNPAKHEYKFSSVAKIPGETPENGFLLLKVSSNDEAFMKKYVAKLEQTKIVMEETQSTKEKEENIHPLMEESNIPVNLAFDWTNFSFTREKGKLYAVRIINQKQSKALVYYLALNGSYFDYGWGFATVNVYNTYNYNNQTYNNATWYFHNGSNHAQTASFFNKVMSYHDNLEVRCFQHQDYNTYPYWDYSYFKYFNINGIYTYYRPRVNYVSPEMPVGFMDVNAITHANGASNTNPFMPASAAITLYIAG